MRLWDLEPLPFSSTNTGVENTNSNGWISVALSLAELVGRLSHSYDELIEKAIDIAAFERVLTEVLSALITDFKALGHIFEIPLEEVLERNIRKVHRRWGIINNNLDKSGRSWADSEKIPPSFDVWLSDDCGRVDITIAIDEGMFHVKPDPLTDNAYDPDGYRFHDIFHFAYAAILGWSPVTRSLLSRKRKSNPRVDEVEDGGRAIAIEEGISAMVFSSANNHKMFEGVQKVDESLLRTIQDMTKRLEVSARSSAEWQEAIIRGFDVWREIFKAGGGHIRVDSDQRRIQFVSDEKTPPHDGRLHF